MVWDGALVSGGGTFILAEEKGEIYTSTNKTPL